MPIFRTILLGFFSCLLLSLGGCRERQAEHTDDGRLVIHYWEKWTGFEGDAMQAVVDTFNAGQDRIFVKKLTVSQIDQKLMLATAGGNPPDLAGLWSHSIVDFAGKGALTPLDRMLTEAGISRDDYIPVYWDLCEYRGFVWGLPTTPATVALHWNRKMFRDAGLDPDHPPRSIEELEVMNERLTVVELARDEEKVRVRYSDLTHVEKEARDFRVLEVGHLPQQPGWWMPMWCFWFGGDLWDGRSELTADSPEMIRTYEWFARQSEKYGVDNLRGFRAGFGNFSSPQNPFLSGKVAMVLQGVWMNNFIDKYAPHLEWGAAPFPSIDATVLADVTIAECDVIVMPKGAPNPAAAFEFLEYLSSQEAMELLNMGQRKFSPLSRTSEQFIVDHPNPHIQVFIDLARSPNVHTVPRLPVWAQYRDELQVAIDKVQSLTAIPGTALAAAQKRASRTLERELAIWDRIENQRLEEWSNYDPR